MTGACGSSCKGCSSQCATTNTAINSNQSNGKANNKPEDIEDYRAELSALYSRTRFLEDQLARSKAQTNPKLRSAKWFNRVDDPSISALYLERYLGCGLSREELTSGKPIVGIAQSGSDLAPCNQYHRVIAKRVRDGIRTAGGIPLEFPTHPIQESTRRPSATLDRNLMYLGLVELLYAYPFDGVVMLTGCDKTTPACLMAAATMNIPAVCLNVGPMINGWDEGRRIGSGSIVWESRERYGAGEIDSDQMLDMIASGTPGPGHCNTMGTAATMNALAETLGMALPGSAAIPAPYKERMQTAYQTGLRIVDMVKADLKPSDIMTREAFENAIVVNTAIGGSTNAPIHLNAVAKHVGVPLDLDDWDRIGYRVPLLLNMQPAGEMLSEDYYRAGGLPAILAELLFAGKLPHPGALTCNGLSIEKNARSTPTWDRRTIRTVAEPLRREAGFLHLRGNLFDSAIMKTSVISDGFRAKFLSDPADPNAFECATAVFDGPEDYAQRLETSSIDDRTVLIMRGVGPLGYPGAAEVVNMHPPHHLLRKGVNDLPCIGDGRQSGTSGSPSILNVTPEAANGGNLALVRDGDRVRVDLSKRRVDLLVPGDVLKRRREELEAVGGYKGPESHTPWQDLFRRETGGLSEGMVMTRATRFQRVAQNHSSIRDNH
ncbi:hypothetical protein N3K66_004493 [Trichothecium roseum]|uniref:Uncharacterized protein n=1 Tax=Trichothecium roseum TaxID=47278 RepID=A0ACC0V460_9HYPO|nr:hypothetical protein N3K66_004493 [Trichothecium roseum]